VLEVRNCELREILWGKLSCPRVEHLQ
jgi:hypothetical protein